MSDYFTWYSDRYFCLLEREDYSIRAFLIEQNEKTTEQEQKKTQERERDRYYYRCKQLAFLAVCLHPIALCIIQSPTDGDGPFQQKLFFAVSAFMNCLLLLPDWTTRRRVIGIPFAASVVLEIIWQLKVPDRNYDLAHLFIVNQAVGLC